MYPDKDLRHCNSAVGEGLAPPEYLVQLKPCGEVMKEQLRLLKNKFPRGPAQDFIIIPNHIHAYKGKASRQAFFRASLREGGGPRSGGRSKRARKQWFALYGVFAFVFLVEAKVSSLLCAFSFRHPCGAGRWGKATAPCSHPGGSHSDSRRQADMESAPTI